MARPPSNPAAKPQFSTVDEEINKEWLEILDAITAYWIEDGYSPSSVRGYRVWGMRIAVKATKEGVRPAAVTADFFKGFVSKYLQHAPATRYMAGAACNAVLTGLRELGVTQIDNIKTPPPPRRNDPEIVTTDTIQELIAAAAQYSSPRDPLLGLETQTILTILRDHALRATEVAGLKIDNLILSNKKIVGMRFLRKGQRFENIALSEEVGEIIEKWLQARHEFESNTTSKARSKTKGKQAFLFPAPKTNGPTSYGRIYLMVKRIAAHAGLRFRPHLFRNFFAQEGVRAGISLRVIQKEMGHSSLMSLQPYYGATMEDLEAAQKIRAARRN